MGITATSALKKVKAENKSAADVSRRLSLYDIHGQMGILRYEFFKAMSPLRAIIALEDASMNEADKEMARGDAVNLASVALIALTKTNEDLSALCNLIEDQDMAESRKGQGFSLPPKGE